MACVVIPSELSNTPHEVCCVDICWNNVAIMSQKCIFINLKLEEWTEVSYIVIPDGHIIEASKLGIREPINSGIPLLHECAREGACAIYLVFGIWQLYALKICDWWITIIEFINQSYLYLSVQNCLFFRHSRYGVLLLTKSLSVTMPNYYYIFITENFF